MGSCVGSCRCYCTVWLEILAGGYFSGLLKIFHFAEFNMEVEPVLAIMTFIKRLIERAEISLGGFDSVRTKLMMKCN